MKKLIPLLLAAVFLVMVSVKAQAPLPSATLTVTNVSFLDQTGPIAPFALVSPTNEHRYRVSCYITSNGAGVSTTGQVSWTDSISSISNASIARVVGSSALGQVLSGDITIDVAGGSIVEGSTGASVPSGQSYNAYFVVEKLPE